MLETGSETRKTSLLPPDMDTHLEMIHTHLHTLKWRLIHKQHFYHKVILQQEKQLIQQAELIKRLCNKLGLGCQMTFVPVLCVKSLQLPGYWGHGKKSSLKST